MGFPIRTHNQFMVYKILCSIELFIARSETKFTVIVHTTEELVKNAGY